MKFKQQICFILFCLIFFISCSFNDFRTKTKLPLSSEKEFKFSVSKQYTPTPAILTQNKPDNTKLSGCRTEISKSIAPVTQFPTPTPTPIPTVLSATQIAAWRNLIVFPPCELPCWWNLRPGYTTSKELKSVLESNPIHLGSYQRNDNEILYEGTVFLGNYTHVNLLEVNGVITRISVWDEGGIDKEAFTSLWNKYDTREILTTYGVPTRILIQTFWSLRGRYENIRPFTLLLFYDQSGFLIMYDGMASNKSRFSICPTFQGNLENGIYIYIKPLDDITPLENLPGMEIGDTSDLYPLSDISGLTTQDFYEMIINGDSDPCFENILQ